MISELDEIKKILNQNDITDLDQIEYGSEVYEELFEYYMEARTGMPDEWIIDRLIDLGLDKELEQKQDLADHYRWKGML